MRIGHGSKAAWKTPVGTPHLDDTAVHVWRTSLDVPDSQLCTFAASLSPEEHSRAARFAFDRDRRRFIAGRGWLRAVLSDYLAIEPGDIELSYGPFGKPELTGADTLQFNLSHSNGLALLGVCQGRAIGIDLEAIRPMPDAEQIAERSFSLRERRDLRHLPASHRLNAFFHVWTCKEAFLKSTGDGLSRALDDFDVSLPPGKPALLRVGADPRQAARWSVAALTPAPDFVAALVVEGALGSVTCWTWGETACANVVGVRFANLGVL